MRPRLTCAQLVPSQQMTLEPGGTPTTFPDPPVMVMTKLPVVLFCTSHDLMTAPTLIAQFPVSVPVKRRIETWASVAVSVTLALVSALVVTEPNSASMMVELSLIGSASHEFTLA